ncbi:MAG TPA: glycosyltransferase [Vicinamibacterales bacterium]|nr:glycosyltransferase [Vicinamibacterales bacterium]
MTLQGRPLRDDRPTEIRVALCTPGEIWGGIEQFVDTMSRHLLESGVPVLVIVLHDGLLRARLERKGVPVVWIQGRSPYDPGVVGKMATALREHGINIVHSHGYRATVLGAVAARLAGARFVRTEHGSLEPVTGSGRLKRTLNIALERVASRYLADAVVFVSQDLRRRTRGASAAVRQEVIYNGIERIPIAMPPIALEGFDDAAGLFNVGIVGRIAPVKGHLELLKALEQIEHIRSLRLYVFGEGPLEEECRRRCQTSGLSGVVRFMGFRQNIHDYLRRLDLLAMPSLHEGLPYTLLEAMSLGVPIVATRVGGLAEIIEDRVTGVLVPVKDSAALATAIELVRHDDGLRETLSSNSQRVIADRFTASAMAEKYLQVYRGVLSGGPAGRMEKRASYS